MAAQFDVFRLPNGSLAVLLQDDLHEGLATRVIAPLVPLSKARPQPTGISPVVDFAEQPHAILVQSLAAVAASLLKKPCGSLAHCRDSIIRALDLLFTGV